MGDALRYLTNPWTALPRDVDDGRLAIDNNRAENPLRDVAVGRTHWLFAGSFEGARRAALLYSLVQSCKLVGLSPFDYLKDVLLRLVTDPHQHIDRLTPKAGPGPSARAPPDQRPSRPPTQCAVKTVFAERLPISDRRPPVAQTGHHGDRTSSGGYMMRVAAFLGFLILAQGCHQNPETSLSQAGR